MALGNFEQLVVEDSRWRDTFAGARAGSGRGAEQGRTLSAMPKAIQSFTPSKEASRFFTSRMEPGSRAQAIASDTQCTHDKASFASVGRPTEALHE